MPKLVNKSETPQELKPFIFHGVDLTVRGTKEQATADCPFCDREEKFYVDPTSGKWDCKVCGSSGNPTTFLRQLHEMFTKQEGNYDWLRVHRKLLHEETLRSWQVVYSSLTKEWLIPGYGIDGKLNQLYRYVFDHKKKTYRPFATPGLNHQLHGINLFTKRKQNVFVTEGPWDAMALWEILSAANIEANVIAVPGCNVFLPIWLPLFAGRKVILLYDNDYLKIHPDTKKLIEGGGIAGMKRASHLLSSYEKPPKNISYINWGPKGYDDSLPNGYDIRDLLTPGKTEEERGKLFIEFQERIISIPDIWLSTTTITEELENKQNLETMECVSWDVLVNSWKRALKWFDGLDRALSVMLACVTTTRAGGDSQLWVKIIGPPACLDGETPIYDPINNTTKTVKERYELGDKFYVWSIKGDGIGVCQALPPSKFAPTAMYEVTFKSEKTMKVTLGHKFWNGYQYQSLQELDYLWHEFGERKVEIPFITKDDLMNFAGKYDFINSYDEIVGIKYLDIRPYYDFTVPHTENYWCNGFFHHNSGKSTLCEALSVSSKYIISKSTIRGFHSGFKTDREGKEDNSLVKQIYDKTLVTKDGDTLLQSPNLSQILSEARDVYDRVSRTDYRNGMRRNYKNICMTWILCGTSSLRQLDSSELGERFLDCVIMEDIDEEMEEEVLFKVAHRTDRNMSFEVGNGAEQQDDEDMKRAKQLTGGYVDYLRENAITLLGQVVSPPEMLNECIQLAKLTAYLRARPSVKQAESAERELASRLVSQIVRLAKGLVVVLNRKTLDKEVLRRVRLVALDTCRGLTLELVKIMHKEGDKGCEVHYLASMIGQSDEKTRSLLRFLRKIKVVELFKKTIAVNVKGKPRWRLTERLSNLYQQIFQVESVEK